MTHRGRAALSVAAMAVTAAAHGEGYSCVASQVTGFHYSETDERWVPVNFPSESKYIVSRATTEQAAVKRWAQMVGHVGPVDWIVKKIGSHDVHAVCNSPQKDNLLDALTEGLGVIKCSGLMSEFMFNPTTLQFQNYLWGGYSTMQTADDTALEIGECSKL